MRKGGIFSREMGLNSPATSSPTLSLFTQLGDRSGNGISLTSTP